MNLKGIRWEDTDWTQFAHGKKVQWRALVNTALKLQVP
jgi:hypothetical protein